ncbi:MAG: choice-of-anchor D domain-containing protein [Bacteriovoracaceae bacterium]|jgi:hypothetical protein|nr:choice-of-anchor D domain-containing protein [Bacteriovoracaceae bacterium]
MIFRALLIFMLIALSSCNWMGDDVGDPDVLFEGSIQKNTSHLVIQNNETYLGRSVINFTSGKSLKLYASGAMDITNVRASVSGNPNFALTGTTCNKGITAGSYCSLYFTFLTTVVGGESTTLVVDYFDGEKPITQHFTLSITSDPPLLFSITGTYNFGNKFVNTANDKVITINNTSPVDSSGFNTVNVAAPFSYKGGTFPGTGGTCAASLASGDSCTIILTFTPPVNGAFSNTVTFQYQSLGQTVTSDLILQGTGLYPASLSVSDSGTYDFGLKATTGYFRKTYTVTYDSGDVSALSLGATFTGSKFQLEGGWPGFGGTCGATLTSATGSCTFVVSMYSTTHGVWADAADFTYNDGQTVQAISRNVQGETRLKPTLTVSDSGTYNFPRYNLKSPSTMTKTYTVTYASGVIPATSVTVTNMGGAFRFNGGGGFPGTGGTCGSTLAAGTCTFVVQYLPSTRSTNHTRTYNLQYSDTITTNSISRSAAGATDGLIVKLDSTALGSVVSGTTSNFNTRLRLSGGVTVTGVSGAVLAGTDFDYVGGSYPGTGGSSCPIGTFSGADCYLYFTFSSAIFGGQNQLVTINYTDQFSAQVLTFNLTATVVTAASLDITGANFGSVDVLSTSTNTYTVTNNGGQTATGMSGTGLASPFTFLGGSYPGTGGNCGSSLGAAGTCSLKVQFAPTANGLVNDDIEVPYNDGAAAQTATKNITGTGNLTSNLLLSGSNPVSFGSKYTSTSADTTFTITHGGGGTVATGLGATFTTGTQYSFPGGSFPGGGTCGVSLSAGQVSCTFKVRFTPLTSGVKNDTVTVNYTSGGPQTIPRTLTGTGLDRAVLTISETDPWDYGSKPINTSTDKVFTVSKTGFSALSVTPVALGAPFTFKGGSYPGTGGNCGGTISAASCTIVVRFTPTTSIYSSDTITLNYNDGTDPQVVARQIEGTGIPSAHITFTVGSYNYGNVTQNGLAETTLTLNYSGEGTVSAITADPVPAPFQYKGGTYPGTGGSCNTSLASGSCTIVVEFAPTSIAAFSETLTLNYNDGNSGFTESVTLNGSGIAQATLTFTDGGIYNYGGVVQLTVSEYTLTLQNGGSSTATSIVSSGISSEFRFKGGIYPGTGGNCSTSLAAAGSCTMVVEFAPPGLGGYAQTLQIDYNDGSGATLVTIDLSGTGTTVSLLRNLTQLIPLQEADLSEMSDVEELLITASKVNNDNEYIANDFQLDELLQSDQNIEIEPAHYVGTTNKIIYDNARDGFSQHIVGFPLLEKIALISGESGEVVYSKGITRAGNDLEADYFGLSSRIMADFNGDGLSDLITASYIVEGDFLRIKEVFIISIREGETLFKFAVPPP